MAINIFYIDTLHKGGFITKTMDPPISALTDFEVISKSHISDSITKLGVITCDICKTSSASYDVFVKGIGGVAFLKRCCDQCLSNIT